MTFINKIMDYVQLYEFIVFQYCILFTLICITIGTWKKEKQVSPYLFLKRQREEPVSDFEWKKPIRVLKVIGVLLYLLMPYYVLMVLSIKYDSIITIYSDSISDIGWNFFSISLGALAVEKFFTDKSKEELSAAFFEIHKLNSKRMWGFASGVGSGLLFMIDKVFLTVNPSPELFTTAKYIIFIYVMTGSIYLFLAHVVFLVWTMILHVLFLPDATKEKLATMLHFSKMYKTCIRSGSEEVRREALWAILECYDIYSKKILGGSRKGLASIEFSSPLVEISDNNSEAHNDGNDRNHELSLRQKYWYRKSLYEIYYLYFLALLPQIMVLRYTWNGCAAAGLWRGIIIIPVLIPALFIIISLSFLIKTREKNYRKVIWASYSFKMWNYIFTYRNGRTYFFSQYGFLYHHSHRREPKYIRSIMSLLEYVRQTNAYESVEEHNTVYHRNLKEHFENSFSYGGYELAQYRSLLILFNFALRKECGALNTPLNETELQDFRYCLDSLGFDSQQKQRVV